MKSTDKFVIDQACLVKTDGSILAKFFFVRVFVSENFIVLFFTRKASTVIFIEVG